MDHPVQVSVHTNNSIWTSSRNMKVFIDRYAEKYILENIFIINIT